MSVTLDEIRVRSDRSTYPTDVLTGCRSALVLFAAAFLGSQDSIFIADAGLTATCVDIKPELLHDMASVYPSSWEFVVADAFMFANACGERFDLVTVDCWSGQFDECAAHAGLWCSLARVAVVLGSGTGTQVDSPDGWEITNVVKRSDFAGGTFWTVMETTA